MLWNCVIIIRGLKGFPLLEDYELTALKAAQITLIIEKHNLSNYFSMFT